LSLINNNVDSGEITYSLMAYKLKHFSNSFLLIIPFKVERDVRNIPRAVCTFNSIKRQCKAFSQQSGQLLEGEERRLLIDGLLNRIMMGFGWQSQNNKLKIYRYRLVTILHDEKRFIDSDTHIHHTDGITQILNGSNDCLNDTIRNLKILPMSEHNALHNYCGDDGYVNYCDL
jgi:hypothetical protein